MTYRDQFEKELKTLKEHLVDMADAVIDHIHQGFASFTTKDTDLAKTITRKDRIIDEKEYHIEKECMNIIMREQPVAKDLRLITSVLKMITDLERIGDHAADISDMTIFMEKTHETFEVKTMETMMKNAQYMIEEAVQSFVNEDVTAAVDVIRSDDVIDDLFEQTKDIVADAIRGGRLDADYAIYLMMVAKYLERIGDHAVNLGEWVIFSVTGKHEYPLNSSGEAE